MKIHTFIIIASLLFTSTTYAQTMNKMVNDTSLNQEVLIDCCDRAGLESGEFGTYFKLEYEDYQVNDSLVMLFEKKIRKYDISIVFGSWCSDSEQQVPRFYKILDHTTYNTSKLKVIAVNRSKNTQEIPIEELGIERVPTFIVYRKGKEVGRIIETPVETLEEDIWKIIQ